MNHMVSIRSFLILKLTTLRLADWAMYERPPVECRPHIICQNVGHEFRAMEEVRAGAD